MKPFNQKYFAKPYFVDEHRGGFKNFNWKDHKGQQQLKLDWIEYCYRHLTNKQKEEKVRTMLFGACALGFEVKEARSRGYSAVGFDMSDYALEHADPDTKKFLSKCDLRDMSMFKDNSFDIVCVFDGIHIVSMEDRRYAYEELNRVAKKGLVLRTRVYKGKDKQDFDDTYDGELIHRESLLSVIQKVEVMGKFTLWKLDMSSRWVAWYAFGLEKDFPITFHEQLVHERQGVV